MNKSYLDKISQQAFGKSIPQQTIPLPSTGVLYPLDKDGNELKEIDVRIMVASDLNILYSKNLIKSGKAFSMILKNCCLSDRDVDELIVGDRNAILIAIRAISFGTIYETKVKCQDPECPKTFDGEFDISKINLKLLELKPIQEYTNMFKFVLPQTQKEVVFKFLTGKDSQDLMSAKQNKMKGGGGGLEDDMTATLKKMVITIDGKGGVEAAQAIDVMEVRDSLSLRQYIIDSQPDVELLQEMTCPVCESVYEYEFDMDYDFFYPRTGQKK